MKHKFLFSQLVEQITPEVLHFLSCPAILCHAGQADVGHIGSLGYICTRNRRVGGTAASVVGIRLGSLAAHLVSGFVRGTWQQGAGYAKVYDCHIDNGHAPATILLCLLLFRRLGIYDHGQVRGTGGDRHFCVACK